MEIKKMKNSEIATAFKDGYEAKNSNESFFVEVKNGVTMAFSYGYHFPICLKFEDGVLFNKNGYSNTTAKHKNLILNTLHDDLNDEDFKTTEELIYIVHKIKYGELKTKSELIEAKI